MKQTDQVDQLDTAYQALLETCIDMQSQYKKQYHLDLSPVGWHLGHCIYTESYWIREMFLGSEVMPETLKTLYIPALSIKAQRSACLPDWTGLLQWSRQSHSENLELLSHAMQKEISHELLNDHFLLHFLVQHYAQHLETLQMIKAQLIKSSPEMKSECLDIKHGESSHPECKRIPAGNYLIGSDHRFKPYDNEHPSHEVQLCTYLIASHPVSQEAYLGFIEAGGYQNQHLWSKAGWQWKKENNINCPEYWFKSKTGYKKYNIYQDANMNNNRTPVYGLNYYEATAYANWVGARLPHEYEWEAADQLDQLNDTGLVWEWCNNPLHPYPEFSAFPYEGYSVPYFDNNHYVLKGGSIKTQNCIKRRTFRNFYEPDIRFIFAGIRLVFD